MRPSLIKSLIHPGAKLWLQGVWKSLQALIHPVHSPPHPLGHTALPLSVLRQKVSPEVRHEETHLHSHRWGRTPAQEYVQRRNCQPEFTISRFIHQVRSHTCARCAVKDSAKAPTSSPTAESTAATVRSAAPAVSTASSAGWTYSATKRRSAAMETFMLRAEPRKTDRHDEDQGGEACVHR